MRCRKLLQWDIYQFANIWIKRYFNDVNGKADGTNNTSFKGHMWYNVDRKICEISGGIYDV